MFEPRIDRPFVDRLLALVAERLDGAWLSCGAWFRDDRVAEDVDLFDLDGTQRHALMELAVELGLPVEAVNSAAELFVRRIPDWRAQLVPLVSGRATIFRPSATLFLLLAVERLSERDLDDCTRLCEVSGEPIDRSRVRDRLAALPETADSALAERRIALARTLDRP